MRRIAFSMVLGIGMLAAPAMAQDPGELRCWTKNRVVVCDEIVVEGDGGPRAFVLFGRTQDRYEAPALERDLVREIPRSVRRSPF